jgi:hypothetical protein
LKEKNKCLLTSVGTTGYPHAKKNEFRPFIKLFTKINTKWITYLNIYAIFVKLVEENVGVYFSNLELNNCFLDTNSKEQATTE